MDVAIVGMACMFPGAPNLSSYYANLCAGVDAISSVPPARIDPRLFEAQLRDDSQLYCARGGFIDAYAEFDSLGFGVMPVAARGAEPDQLLALQVATSALEDAGYAHRSFPRERTAVILGRGGYSTAARTRLDQRLRGAQQVTATLRALLPDLDTQTLIRVRDELQAQIDAPGPDAVIGIVPNLTASRIAHRLDLRGAAWTVDAACASSLIAVEHGCRELESGRADLVLAGGVHVCLSDGFWSVFCSLGALSRKEQIRPFDRRADGLLIGEGLGVVVLKRLAEAERDGDCIYAVIRGVASSSDGRGATLLSPAVEGQVLALERAWKESGLDPRSVGLVEAHGTATAAGDQVELTTLARVFGAADASGERAVVGSVKSMIGHAMPAAGAAGLIKAALAVHHGTLFPTLHCEEPHPLLEQTRFRVISRAEPWKAGALPRRAGVNAFGFGGVNAHVVLEEHAAKRTRVMAAPPRKAALGDRLACFSAPDVERLLQVVERGAESVDQGPVRAALLDPSEERLGRLAEIVKRGKAWRGRESIWFSPQGLLRDGGSVALLFPGIDVAFEPQVEDLAHHFGIPLRPVVRPNTLEEQTFGVVEVNRFLCSMLEELGVQAAHLAGHSIGEWSALMASGALLEAERTRFMESLKPGRYRATGVPFAAAGCDVMRAREALAGLADVAISHDNCPHQVLLCGRESSLDVALARLTRAGVMCQKLPFQSGFHTPFLGEHAEHFRAEFARLDLVPPTRRLWSATTCAPYPHEPAAIRELSVRHLLEPVRFRELLEKLHEQGARVFVQAGVGSLTGFVEDSLRGKPHLALNTNVKDASGLDQIRRVLLALFVEGADGLRFERVAARPRRTMQLALGVPVASEFTPLTLSKEARLHRAPEVTPDSLAGEFREALEAIEAAQRDVFALLDADGLNANEQASEPVAREPRSWSAPLRLSVARDPSLLDHALFPQRPGWDVVTDLFPVVPLTMLIDLAIEYALAGFPGQVAVAIEDMRALRWFEVGEEVEAEVKCSFDGHERVQVQVGEHVTCTVVLAQAYPDAPAYDARPPTNPRPSPVSGAEVYTLGRMFHGPAYQGIERVHALGDDGLTASIRVPSGRAALLDNAGQLFGLWIQERYELNRMAFPVGARRIRFFGPEPACGALVECSVRVRSENDKGVLTDMMLAHDGQVWAAVETWEDRRFETDARLWNAICSPAHNLLSSVLGDGLVLFDDSYRMATTRQQLAARFLGQAERDELRSVKNPRLERAWLAGRIAAKDAVRALMCSLGEAELYPAEVQTRGEGATFSVSVPGGRDVRIALAQSGELSVAVASESRELGLALQRVEPRFSRIRAGSLPRGRAAARSGRTRRAGLGTPVGCQTGGCDGRRGRWRCRSSRDASARPRRRAPPGRRHLGANHTSRQLGDRMEYEVKNVEIEPLHEHTSETVLADIAGMIRQVIGEEYAGDLEIGMETSFANEIELESIELVALTELLRERYGDTLDLPSWLGNMELNEIIALKVGNLVERIVLCMSEPATA
ncbi:MAG: beta-ketoacyl synthase N-terminal-like domain-containing protein [Myxococcales bacterium]